MTLVVGYALGPLPGFTVGALGMLVSNFMLGQGPYTPWQMAAWGMVGLGGAVLGRLSGRRLGRVPLALACGVARAGGQGGHEPLHVDARREPHSRRVPGGRRPGASPTTSPTRSRAFSSASRSRPSSHGCWPECAVRMDVTWEQAPLRRRARRGPAQRLARRRSLRRRGIAARSSRVASTLLLGGTRAAAAHALRSRASSRSSNAPRTPTAASAARAGSPAASSTPAGPRWASPRPGATRSASAATATRVLDALRGEASSLQGAGDLERTILALHACGVSVRSLPAVGDPVSTAAALPQRRRQLRASEQPHRVRGLRAARGRVLEQRTRRCAARRGWLLRQQNADGGFGFATRGGGSDVDDTAAALQALVDAGHGRHRPRASARLPRPRPEPRRRLPAAERRRVERAVDRLGDPGPGRGRTRSPQRHAPGQPLAARVPRRRCSPPTAACATPARAPRRRCG